METGRAAHVGPCCTAPHQDGCAMRFNPPGWNQEASGTTRCCSKPPSSTWPLTHTAALWLLLLVVTQPQRPQLAQEPHPCPFHILLPLLLFLFFFFGQIHIIYSHCKQNPWILCFCFHFTNGVFLFSCLNCSNNSTRKIFFLMFLPIVSFSQCVIHTSFLFLLVQSLSQIWLCNPMNGSTPGPLSFIIFWSLLKLMSIEPVMLSNHLILCRPFLLLPSVFPSIRVFFSESALHIRWPKYWSFSFGISPFNKYFRVGFL